MSHAAELYKDKIEVSLDARQIFYLFFGGSVIVGLVFVLGVMVGRRVEARSFVERAHNDTTLDPLAALDRLEGSGGLSFAATLRGAEAAPAPVDKIIEAKASVKADKPEAKNDAKNETKPEAKNETKAEAKADVKADAKPEAKADAKPEKKAVTDDSAKPEKKAVTDDSAKADAKLADDKPEKKAHYTLQLSSFHDRAEADAFAQSIKASGFQPYIIEGDVDGKQFYRVRIGSYRTLDAANDAKAELEKASKRTGIVTKL